MSTNTGLDTRIDWADVVFVADAHREPFEDVSIVTTKNAYYELAHLAAVEILSKRATHRMSDAEIMEFAQRIMDEHKVFVQEQVEVSSDGISVCINATTVDDDDVVWRALDMLANALKQLEGSHGTVYFSEPLHYTSSEIHWATTH